MCVKEEHVMLTLFCNAGFSAGFKQERLERGESLRDEGVLMNILN